MPGKHRNILSTVAKGRRVNRHDVYAVEKVFAEAAVIPHLAKITVGRKQYAGS